MPKTLTSKQLTGGDAPAENPAPNAADAADAEMAARARGEEPAPQEQETVGKRDAGEHVDVNHYEEEFLSLADEFDVDDKVADYHNPKQEAKAEEPAPVEETPTPEETPAEVLEETAEEKAGEEAEETPPAEEAKTEEAETPTEDVQIPEVPQEDTEEKRSPEEVEKVMNEAREKAHEQLVETFKLTEEQEEAMMRSPNEVLPQLAANLYLDLFDSMMKGVQQQLPFMVNSLIQQQTAKKRNQQAFFNAWPDLAKKEYLGTIERISNNYRAANPTVDADTAIKEIGAQAWVALRLPLDQLVALTSGQPAQETVPEQRPSNVAHMPASTGNVPQKAKAPVRPALNEFEQLAEEFLDDDDI